MMNMHIEGEQSAVILEIIVRLKYKICSATDPRRAHGRDEPTECTPDSLATFAVTQTKSNAFTRVIDELTGPLVTICVKHGDGK